MLLAPRYEPPPIVALDGPPSEVLAPLVRQRRRLEQVLADLEPEQWAASSRCEGWTVQDVVTHLVSTNGFWALSIEAGVAGEPTRFLGAFDPVASPAQLVDQERGTPVTQTLEQLMTSTDRLASVIEGLDTAGWDALAEAPPGHLPVRLVADHALWDGWVHERDILLPLGRHAVADPDEVLTCLRYSAALGRAFEACAGRSQPGTVELDAQHPDARIVVSAEADRVRVHDDPAPAGSPRAEGDAVELLEMLSARDVGGPVPAAVRTLMEGLAVVFDQARVA